MSDDVKALIAAADTVSVQFVKDFPDATFRLIAGMRDALEAAQQAPAVDREALVAEIRAAYVDYSESADFPTTKHYLEWKLSGGAEREFDRMVAEVEARGLEKAADEWQVKGWAGTPRHVDRVADRMGASQYALEWLRARAQQVREGNA